MSSPPPAPAIRMSAQYLWSGLASVPNRTEARAGRSGAGQATLFARLGGDGGNAMVVDFVLWPSALVGHVENPKGAAQAGSLQPGGDGFSAIGDGFGLS